MTSIRFYIEHTSTLYTPNTPTCLRNSLSIK